MIRPLLAVSLLLAAAPLSAQHGDRTERVKFARGTASKVIKGELRGQSGITYVVGARARQLMTVTATTSNGSTFFDVIGPSGGEPVFNGFESATASASRCP
ncbi:hypothetical protein [Sphingomonas sp.]|uniref:hypothetical protein n=1 Tax=Sphingomonas sp. TaxID=28214 RepID=UPI0031E43D34